jgi:cytochrome c-type biogenesis protein CcmE
MSVIASPPRSEASKRGRVGLAIAVIVGGLAWVAVSGLKNNLVYYKTPTEILNGGPSIVNQRIRLGGLVLPGTVRVAGRDVEFMVSDDTTRMSVVTSQGVPSLFRAGQGAVVEGYYGRDGIFHADAVLVKHSDYFGPPAPGQTPHSADLAGNG